MRELVDSGVESLTVGLINSYVNPAHEERLRALARRRCPGLSVSTSADVFPFAGEYERFTTATINAYVQPMVDRYLGRLEAELAREGFRGRLYIMASSGGTLTVSNTETITGGSATSGSNNYGAGLLSFDGLGRIQRALVQRGMGADRQRQHAYEGGGQGDRAAGDPKLTYIHRVRSCSLSRLAQSSKPDRCQRRAELVAPRPSGV